MPGTTGPRRPCRPSRPANRIDGLAEAAREPAKGGALKENTTVLLTHPRRLILRLCLLVFPLLPLLPLLQKQLLLPRLQ